MGKTEAWVFKDLFNLTYVIFDGTESTGNQIVDKLKELKLRARYFPGNSFKTGKVWVITSLSSYTHIDVGDRVWFGVSEGFRIDRFGTEDCLMD